MSRIDRSAGTTRQPRIDTKPTESKTTTTVGSNKATNRADVKDGFVQAKGANAVTAKASGGAGELPAEVKTGTRDYYKQRYDDFVRRNPGVQPPDYYLNYGDKYCQKFSNLTSKDLSPEGLKWRDATLKNLQDAIEKKRAEDPAGFAQLERDPAAFKAFAYGTHPDAYIKGGLFKLPAKDLAKIAMTPEFKDLLGKDGIKQVVQVMMKMGPKDIASIGLATLKDLAREAGIHMPSLPHFELPHLPHFELPHLPFAL